LHITKQKLGKKTNFFRFPTSFGLGRQFSRQTFNVRGNY